MALEQFFPDLRRTGYSVTSPASADYNCIAWAAGVADEWWWPDPMGINPWPAGVRREESVAAFIELFQSFGYVPCPDDSLEPGVEKVALYALAGAPKHAARQLPNGRWTSKLGPLEDVEHSLDGLVGDWYGTIVQIFRRSLSNQRHITECAESIMNAMASSEHNSGRPPPPSDLRFLELETLLRREQIHVDTFRLLEGWEENGILMLSIPGKQAHEVWTRLVNCTPAAGYYPLVTTIENVGLLTRDCRANSVAAARDEALERSRELTFDGWLSQERDPLFQVAKYTGMAEQIEKYPGGEASAKIYRDIAENWRNCPPWHFDPANCPWPDEPVHVRPPDELYCVHNAYENVSAETAAVLLVPTGDSCEVPAHLLFGGFNSCPPPEVHVAMLRSMQTRFGARLLLIDSGIIGIVVSRRPANRDEALRLAKDFTTYAESFEGTAYNKQSEGHIAAYLLASDYWAFWWD